MNQTICMYLPHRSGAWYCWLISDPESISYQNYILTGHKHPIVASTLLVKQALQISSLKYDMIRILLLYLEISVNVRGIWITICTIDNTICSFMSNMQTVERNIIALPYFHANISSNILRYSGCWSLYKSSFGRIHKGYHGHPDGPYRGFFSRTNNFTQRFFVLLHSTAQTF
jgi:hypothetical protein